MFLYNAPPCHCSPLELLLLPRLPNSLGRSIYPSRSILPHPERDAIPSHPSNHSPSPVNCHVSTRMHPTQEREP